MRNRFGRRSWLASAALAAFLTCPSVHAQTSDEEVHDLDFRQGEYGIEMRAGTLKPRGGSRQSDALLGIEYGVHDAWETRLGVEYRREPGNGLRFDAVEWQNKFRFLDLPYLPLHVGLLAEVDFFRDSDDGYRLRFGPLLQKEFGELQLNFNLLFERYLDETPSHDTEMSYQWQAKYPLRQDLELGVQGFGEVGEWDNWAPRSEQSHRFGPAVFGEFSIGGSQRFEYDAAYLTDPSSSTRSHGVRLRLNYRY